MDRMLAVLNRDQGKQANQPAGVKPAGGER